MCCLLSLRFLQLENTNNSTNGSKNKKRKLNATDNDSTELEDRLNKATIQQPTVELVLLALDGQIRQIKSEPIFPEVLCQ